MDFNELSNDAEEVRCPYCSSRIIIWRGWRERKKNRGHIGFCKDCRRYFTWPSRNMAKKPITEENLRQYINGKTLRDFEPDYPKSTLHRLIIRRTELIPSWQKAAAEWLDKLQNEKWFKNLVIDTTSLKVGGKKMVYLHAADNYFKRPLIYTIIDDESKDSVAQELRKLREVGYYPDVVTTDLAQELLSAIEEVYKWAKIQGCLFHLSRSLREQLKTKNVPEDVALIREKAKNLILHAACADSSTRKDMAQKLMWTLQLHFDEKTRQVVRNFLDRYLKLYHTLEELNGHAEALTTNLCERHIGLIEKFRDRLYGFKSVYTATRLLNAYWNFYIKNKEKEILKDLEPRKVEGAAAFLLDGHINISRLSEVLGLPKGFLIEMAKKKRKIIILDYPISRGQILRIVELASKVDTVKELADIMALNPRVICKILAKCGFKIEIKNAQVTMDEIFRNNSYLLSRIENARITKL